MLKFSPVVLLLAISACQAHVNLVPPSETASHEQRVEIYKKHKMNTLSCHKELFYPVSDREIMTFIFGC